MSTKLIAMGNILMEDDGIAIYIAEFLKDKLYRMGIEVIVGETDIGYCMAQPEEGDYLILLDASILGKTPGEVTMLTFQEAAAVKKDVTQHSISLLDLIHIYYPKNDGVLLTIETAEVGYHYGLSLLLTQCMETIAQDVLEKIKSFLRLKEAYNGRI